ncbi:PREDICTED: zinc metalloproteinase nas-15-like [Priapulus caudatus]|uniref:Zinc metalloproteinase nas-15-like n=1 Tax=Priapulus caudatus TaxID=37621 RepID=A0ABM1DV68_PRICU|nr:PREDICTED: zinc metalloproteinase nas-15-like [Priapulus caudatus]
MLFHYFVANIWCADNPVYAEDCPEQASWGGCDNNPGFMWNNCRKTCDKCDWYPTLDAINEAIAEYNEHTCIRWVPRTTETDYAHISRRYGGRAIMRAVVFLLCLGVALAHERGNIEHIIEINREAGQNNLFEGDIKVAEVTNILCADNPVYVEDCPEQASWGECDNNPGFMWNNCRKTCDKCDCTAYNFDKYDETVIDLYGYYDLYSIMHYDCYSFSKNNEPTITAKSDPSCNTPLGQPFVGGGFRQSDIDKLNSMYNC